MNLPYSRKNILNDTLGDQKAVISTKLNEALTLESLRVLEGTGGAVVWEGAEVPVEARLKLVSREGSGA